MLTSRRAPKLCKPTRNHAHLSFEHLEQRLVLYAVSGYEWIDPDISFSYVPDGTNVEGYSSGLFSKLDGVAETDVWQREFARALQTWANVSPLNFHEVADNGSPSGTSGPVQGNAGFGDIRLAAHALDGYLAYAYYPVSYHTIGGDIFLATEPTFQIGATYDVYSVLLHEAGHSLGLGHAAGSVMDAYYRGIRTALTADDIAGIRAIYGVRQDDSFDAAARNDELATASALALDAAGTASVAADLTSLADADYYSIVAPAGTGGTLTVSLDAGGLSLLAPRVSIYSAAGTPLTSADVGGAYGTEAAAILDNVVAGDTFYVLADGATDDEFGMGAYRLEIDFGVSGSEDPGGEDPGGEDPGGIPAADRFEVNDSIQTATNLGRFNNQTVTDLSLHRAEDVDFYRFSARKATTFRITTQFQAATDSQLTVYDANGAILAGAAAGSVNVRLAAGQAAVVEVTSPGGDVGTYDLIFEKIGSSGNSNGNGNHGRGRGNLQPEGYHANAGRANSHAGPEHVFRHGGIGRDDVAFAIALEMPHEGNSVGAAPPWLRAAARASTQHAVLPHVASDQRDLAMEDHDLAHENGQRSGRSGTSGSRLGHKTGRDSWPDTVDHLAETWGDDIESTGACPQLH